MYHQVALEKMLQIKNDKGKDLSLNQLNDLVGAMNWRLDRDIQSIQFSETGSKYKLLVFMNPDLIFLKLLLLYLFNILTISGQE